MGINERAQMENAIKALEKESINHKTLSQPSEGVGDTAQKILTTFGITEGLIKRVLGKSCNCGARKKLLNRLFPYAKKD